ncbi:MAG: site-specific DNA-methyltransferase, partial [Betaproteobacteria bacterium]|nr:site-specific DNA-methyltransferase [Betaproteobacteria bacterium]
MTARHEQFDAIKASLQKSLRFAGDGAVVAEGDSLALLRSMPSHSVSLILTDPPYHSTKKQNIYGDTAFAEDAHYLEWMTEYAVEWRRVLKPNG